MHHETRCFGYQRPAAAARRPGEAGVHAGRARAQALRLLEVLLRGAGHAYEALYGSMRLTERGAAIARFNADPQVRTLP